jgi:hypothetical protein
LSEISKEYSLYQNYPNPFNPKTKIRFDIPAGNPEYSGRRSVQVVIYDILGREIKKLVNEELNPGTYEVEFDGTDLPSGIYFYRLSTDNFIDTKKMVLIK